MDIPRRLAAGALFGALTLTLLVVPGLSAPSGAVSRADEEGFVRRAHFDLLNTADPALDDVARALEDLSDSGTAAWLVALQRTPEGHGAIVDDAYDDVFHRDADPEGRDFFIAQLGAGRTQQRINAQLFGSEEYYDGPGGGTDEAFLDALYRDALGRAADAGGRQYFLDQLAAGRTRGSIASYFLLGAEGRSTTVRDLYVDLLRRTGDAGGVQFYAEQLRTGTRLDRVVAALAASAEYRAEANRDLGDEEVIILTPANQLAFSSTGDIEVVDHTVAVTGLAEGSTLLGIDIRPSNGVLYGVASDGQVVTLNPGSGQASPLGAPIPGFAPSGGVGVDFNPMADALRIVTGTRNYRVNATTGALAGGGPDTPLAFVAGDRNEGETPDASAAAYTNSTRGLPLPSETALYDIDEATSSLVQQVPANDGLLVTKGRLRLDATAVNGFDISPDTARSAYALLDAPHAGPSIWKVDLATGEPRLISRGGPSGAIGLAVVGEATVVPDETLYAVTGGVIPVFQTFSTNGETPPAKLLTGLGPFGTTVLGLDVRPATGVIYGLTSLGQLVTIDPSGAQAMATPVGDPIPDFAPDGGVGFDFNPMADAIRVVTGSDNYRLDATTGAVVGEGTETGAPGSLQYAADDTNQGETPVVSGAAYTNSIRSATLPTATALFDIDTDTDTLVRQNPANAGTLLTIGELGVDVTDAVGFDSSGGIGQTTYAVLTVGGTQGLYVVDLATGDATLLEAITPGTYTAFAVGDAVVPAPA